VSFEQSATFRSRARIDPTMHTATDSRAPAPRNTTGQLQLLLDALREADVMTPEQHVQADRLVREKTARLWGTDPLP
jgi:hypothetical protein